ncbi:hypothetical protein [Clostridium sp. C2-6-12]|uniref:hypothetical protein n=1 Tax=Clostridium sp. C2-6-12 TaxID=2698832 RepID=UPI00136A013A|nr:hypothetical protein [Clostridium sp. C2-6-12]
MAGIKCLYITKDNQVYKIPVPKSKFYKPVSYLASQEVLFVLLYYETFNKLPIKLISANFDRIQLNDKGGYELTMSEMKKRYYNFEHYGFKDAETLSQKEYIPIPQATIIPTISEKEALYHYIKINFPLLWSNFSEILEDYISRCIYNDLELKQLVKKASLLRKNALKNSIN